MEDSEAKKNCQRTIGRMPATVEDDGRRFRVYWARLIRGNSESLLTLNTKHSVYEIEYAVSRALTIRLGSDEAVLDEGEFIIVPPETTHQITDSKPDGVKFIMGFDAPGLIGCQISSAAVTAETPVLRSLAETLGVAISDERRRPGLLDSLLAELLLSFLSASPGLPEETPVSENELRLRRFLSYIGESNGVGVTVSGGAKLLNLSQRQLFRICGALCGKTPVELINEKRLEYLMTCLKYKSLTLSEIADMSGFQTEYAMAKFFRRHAKLNPSDYRRGEQ